MSLVRLDNFLDILELSSNPPLPHFDWDCILSEIEGILIHQELDLCGIRESSKKRHWLITLGVCGLLDGLELVVLIRNTSKKFAYESALELTVRSVVLILSEWRRAYSLFCSANPSKHGVDFLAKP